jgi:hypothetical protein
MAYVCVDKMGGELISDEYPERGFRGWNGWRDVYGESCTLISVPKGTIERLIGRELTWEDDPIDLEEFMYHNGDM